MPVRDRLHGTTPAALALLGFLSLPAGTTGAAEGLKEIEECVRGNAPESTLVQTVEIVTTDRTGDERTQIAKMYWRRFDDGSRRMLLEVEAPPEVRGSSYLLIDKEEHDDIFVYLPALGKVRRITARTVSTSLFGTEFTYEDLERLQSITETLTSERLADSELGNRPVYVVRTTPGPDSGSAYTKVISLVDKETCVPLKIEFYESFDVLRKVLTTDPARLTREGKVWVPRHVRVTDLRDNSESRLLVESIQVDGQVSKKFFSLAYLERGR
jgi:hypothetical protein